MNIAVQWQDGKMVCSIERIHGRAFKTAYTRGKSALLRKTVGTFGFSQEKCALFYRFGYLLPADQAT